MTKMDEVMREVRMITQKSQEIENTLYEHYITNDLKPDLAKVLAAQAATQNMIMMAFTSLSLK